MSAEVSTDYIRLLRSSIKDYQNVYTAVERGQSAGAYTLTEANNIGPACSYLETFINNSLSGNAVDCDGGIINARWETIVLALEKACKRGAFGLAEAASIHQSAVRITNAFRSAVVHFEKKAEELKKVKFAPVPSPEDNIRAFDE